ncbi:MAG: nucleoside deaminase [Bacteroides sp.]|nr:nucleoside deaminase [Bacteroides sp.]
MNPKIKFMSEALREAREGIAANHGGPFGSVIVLEDRIVGRGHNRVLLNRDATCHGEMEAIRDACRNLGTHDLSGCDLYTTAEPCPMCLGAILWANIRQVYYGCNVKDTEAIGFRDSRFYDYLAGAKGDPVLTELDRDRCLELFAEYGSVERPGY